MITTNSEKRSAISGNDQGKGWSDTAGIENIAAPMAMQMIGRDKGKRFSASGNQATSAIKKPAPVSHKIYGAGEMLSIVPKLAVVYQVPGGKPDRDSSIVPCSGNDRCCSSEKAWTNVSFHSAPELIREVVMLCIRFPLSLRNVEDLLFERGYDLCHETVGLWWNRFRPMFAADIRRRRVSRMRGFRHGKWHLDEMYVKLNGQMVYSWRAVDHEGEILESYGSAPVLPVASKV